ncbi:DegT/DnrJ/EryC1/StrS family aminotransferase [Candidatus Omnitrophota bacterium]
MKKKIKELAIFSGKPAFEKQLHIGSPNIGDREQLFDRIGSILDRRWLTNDGPLVREFEKRAASIIGAKHCIAVSNATSAIEITARALGLKGEVIIPSFTFIATAHALQWQGIKPVFCDIDAHTRCIDPREAEKLITPRTTAIMGVHLWARTCDIDALSGIAKKHNLRLIFDAAQAFGCSYKGRMVGGFGDAEIFSFHATKFLNTFEGGAVATCHDDLARKVRMMRNFGFSDYDNVGHIGINAKMTEIAAAMGLTGLESMKEFIEVNYRNHKEYQEGLKDIPGISLLAYGQREKSSYHYVVCELDDAAGGISRDQLVDILWAENVLARRYFYPGCHRQQPYRSDLHYSNVHLPETERAAQCVFLLPTGTAVNTDDIRKICRIIRLVAGHGYEVRERLSCYDKGRIYAAA